jgi:hypothetical protein
LIQPAQGAEEGPDPVILTIRDFQGQLIKLTARQWEHIIGGHPDMLGMEWAMRETLEDPEEVRRSQKPPNTTRLYYRWYTNTPVGSKWVCVAVKFLETDAFISTAYVTTKIKEGELIWQK